MVTTAFPVTSTCSRTAIAPAPTGDVLGGAPPVDAGALSVAAGITSTVVVALLLILTLFTPPSALPSLLSRVSYELRALPPPFSQVPLPSQLGNETSGLQRHAHNTTPTPHKHHLKKPLNKSYKQCFTSVLFYMLMISSLGKDMNPNTGYRAGGRQHVQE